MSNKNRVYAVEVKTEKATEYRIYRRSGDECLDYVIASFIDRNDAVVFCSKKNEATTPVGSQVVRKNTEHSHFYRKKSNPISAMQWTGENTSELMEWLRTVGARTEIYVDGRMDRLAIAAPNGSVSALPLDWIIVTTEGHTYPCKPNIFSSTYEPMLLNEELFDA